jgi:hypothetical protein
MATHKHWLQPYKQDNRDSEPNRSGYRRGQFKRGWKNAAEGDHYSSTKLNKELTWNNLGYRFGHILGPTPRDLIELMYDLCVQQQKAKKGF